jgi:photosystem II stability/assembly factor-like uncharacterized protein
MMNKNNTILHNLKVAGFVFLSFALFPKVGNAQPWAACKGPEGASINSFFKKDQTLFAGTNGGGIFSSSDEGMSWKDCSTGLSNDNSKGGNIVYTFTSGDSGIYAGTNGGIYLSGDMGASWKTRNVSLYAKNIKCFGWMGKQLLAGSSDGGVFISTNHGTSWKSVNNGLTDYTVTSMAVKDSTIFIGTFSGGVFVSSDTGKTWKVSNNQLNQLQINALLFKDSILMAGTPGGIFCSSDLGKTWAPKNTGIGGQPVNSLTIANGWTYAGTGAGIFYSKNGGTSWAIMYDDLKYHTIYTVYGSGNFIYAGIGTNGLARGSVDGTSLRFIYKGLLNTEISSLVYVGSNLFACKDKQIYVSSDEGASWTDISKGLSNSLYPAFHPKIYTVATSGTTVFAGTSQGVFRYADADSSWKPLNKGMEASSVNAVTIRYPFMYAATFNGMYCSADSGKSWKDITYDLPTRNIKSVLTLSDTALWAGTAGSGIFKLGVNNHWIPVNTGVSANGKTIYSITAVHDTLLMGSSDGAYRMKKDESTWQKIPITGKGASIINVLCLLDTDTCLYMGTPYGVYKYNKTKGTGVFTTNFLNNYVFTLAASELNIFAGTGGVGIFKSPGNDVITATEHSGFVYQEASAMEVREADEQTLKVKFSWVTQGEVTINIRNILGAIVTSSTRQKAGEYLVDKPQVAGIYLVEVISSEETQTVKTWIE